MRILAIDTATPWLVLGYVEPNTSIECCERAERKHAELLTSTLSRLASQVGCSASKIRAKIIAVGTGPGSYTGVRTGASFALGLGRCWEAQVIGVPTFEAIAAQHEGLVAVTWDAHKGNVYGALYEVTEGIPQTVLAIAKHSALAFQQQVPHNAHWLIDTPPSSHALATLALRKEPQPLQLQYL